MLGELLLLVAIALFALSFYLWATLNNSYFEKRNLKYTKPTFLLGSFADLYANKYTAKDFAHKLYKAFPNESIYGEFAFRVPQFIIRDPDAIKHIFVKAFDHFENHPTLIDENVDKLWGSALFFLKNEKWRHMRATLSPVFTGTRIREMFELVVDCVDGVVKYNLEQSKNQETLNVNMKDLFKRYTTDVIGSCAFGVKNNSLADPTNEFFVNGRKLVDFQALRNLVAILMASLAPSIAKALDNSLSDKTISKHFRNMILDTMETRKKNNIFRPDMINFLMQVRYGTLNDRTDEKKLGLEEVGFATVEESNVEKQTVTRTWNDDEIVAQCFLFLIAGFGTSSTLLVFASYELALNADVQQKLYEEIVETEKMLGGKRVSYDVLQKMKYMDQVVCEALRMWPPFMQIDRICTKDYLYDDGKLKFKIEKDKVLFVPVYGIHHDPKYWRNPDKFDPERFSDENKKNIMQGSFMPFGLGPRNCIGSRFALMNIKALLFHLLLNFSFEPNEKTEIPIKLRKSFNLTPENGMHLQLKKRA